MRRMIAVLGATAAVVPVALAGCGGGGGSSSSGSSFAQAADAACAKADREVAALKAPASSSDLVRYLGKTEVIVLRLGRRIGQLEPPADKASQAYLDGLQRSGTVLNEMFGAAQSENPDAVGELSRSLARLRLGHLAKEAGLAVCAKPLEPTA